MSAKATYHAAEKRAADNHRALVSAGWIGELMYADYYYFKPSGKWKYHGEGAPVPSDHVGAIVHADILRWNHGQMPGLAKGYKATDLTIVIIDEKSFPRMIHAGETTRFCSHCGAPLTPHGICEDDCDGFRASALLRSILRDEHGHIED